MKNIITFLTTRIYRPTKGVKTINMAIMNYPKKAIVQHIITNANEILKTSFYD